MVATLARISPEDARLYEECRLRHAGAVNSYVEARAEALRFNEEREKAKRLGK
jgi:hypothetical protein